MTFEQLPSSMQKDAVRPYFKNLQKHRFRLFAKRVFDVVVSAVILIIMSPIFLVLSIAIKIDSKGPVFYRQIRVGKNDRDFRIFKFRTMVQNADKIGLSLTTDGDPRITRVGKAIRKCRLDEFSQVLNVFTGDMSLVGPRPEVRKYVEQYEPEYMATLLIRPGITATSSIVFKDEDKILDAAQDPEKAYVDDILPEKMRINLEYMRHISVWQDIKIMFRTVGAVLKKDEKEDAAE